MRKLAVAALLLSGLATAPAVQAADKVRFAYTVQVHQANMMVLQDYAKKYNVEIEPVPMRRYADQQLALMTNQVDVAVIGYINVGLMEEKSFRDYRAIEGVFTGGQSLTLAKGVTAKQWKDLEGLKLGTAPNSYSELLFKASATLGGADVAKIQTVSFAAGGPPLLSALKEHQINGFVSWEPNNADAAIAGDGYYSSLDIGANPTHHINGLIAVNSGFLQSHRAAVLGLVRAAIDATNALNADPSKYAEVAMKGTGSSAAVIKEAIPRGKLDYKLYAKETRALLKMVYDAKLTKTDTSGAVDKQFDYTLLSEATGKPKDQLGGE
ncbi:MAG TPA: ABC transporter substrate-binding protein [Xanthobacteraceae bacterium]|jgi:ABC-type nitrate/sulfonate/bicarbonate transport system substrate-binding protein